jgi:hypothetical protein
MVSLITIVNALEDYMAQNPKNADKLQTILAYEIANFKVTKKAAKRPREVPSSSSRGC